MHFPIPIHLEKLKPLRTTSHKLRTLLDLIRKEHLRATEKMESRLGVEAMTVELSAVMEELSEISGTLPADGDRDAWAPGLSAETDRDSEVRVSSERYDRSGGDRSRGNQSRGRSATLGGLLNCGRQCPSNDKTQRGHETQTHWLSPETPCMLM